jgi:hypothetical protein
MVCLGNGLVYAMAWIWFGLVVDWSPWCEDGLVWWGWVPRSSCILIRQLGQEICCEAKPHSGKFNLRGQQEGEGGWSRGGGSMLETGLNKMSSIFWGKIYFLSRCDPNIPSCRKVSKPSTQPDRHNQDRCQSCIWEEFTIPDLNMLSHDKRQSFLNKLEKNIPVPLVSLCSTCQREKV